jgi:hypothetical protein|tara:strand:- start:720 stop:908 length:189 start_codon:yes stop_codon:yes gene_type:complete
MTDLITWLSDNSGEIIGILTGIVTVASLVATMTPNESDNKWVARASKVVSWLALNIGKAKSK